MPVSKKKTIRKNLYTPPAAIIKRHRIGVKLKTEATTEEILFVSLSLLSLVLSYWIIVSGNLYH